jgi:hypothetical protein
LESAALPHFPNPELATIPDTPDASRLPTWFKAAAWEDKTRCIMSGVSGIELGNFNGRVVVVKFKKTMWQVG